MNPSALACSGSLCHDPLANGLVHGGSDLIEAVAGPWVEDQALGLPGDAVRILRALRRQEAVHRAVAQEDRTAGASPVTGSTP
jgi:hypothetical protein